MAPFPELSADRDREAQEDSRGLFRRLVLGYDDSPRARRALARALVMAHRHRAQLVVVATPASRLPAAAPADEVRGAELHGSGERVWREQYGGDWLRAARAFADDHGVDIVEEIRAGPVTREVMHVAAVYDADLIVIGADDRAPRLPVRTSPARVLEREAPCSVLFVR